MVNLAAQAAQAAAQGQQMLQNDQNNAAQYKGQYSNYQQQADAANQSVKNYANAMQGAFDPNTGVGNAGSAYNYELGKQQSDLGYDPQQMTAARSNLNQANGALSAYSDFANTGASKWGMNAGGFAAANSGALSNLNNNIASNQNVVNGLSDLYKTAQTGANQFTGNVIQGEHETMAGLQNTYTNAANARDQAASMMNFYDGLAQQQGNLNAQQQQAYAAAQASYAAATQAMAQAAQLQQQVQFMNDARNKYGLASTMGINPAPPTPNSPTSNASNKSAGGPSIMSKVAGSKLGQGLAEGALNLGRWGWTDTLGKLL